MASTHLYISCHLSCVPKKGNPKKGTRRKFFTACSVVLSTFRKLAFQAQTVRNASPSDSVACLNFRMGLIPKVRVFHRYRVGSRRYSVGFTVTQSDSLKKLHQCIGRAFWGPSTVAVCEKIALARAAPRAGKGREVQGRRNKDGNRSEISLGAPENGIRRIYSNLISGIKPCQADHYHHPSRIIVLSGRRPSNTTWHPAL